jgi:hypothetical protein
MKGLFAGAAAGLGLASLNNALQSSITHMDDLGKSAQKIGIPVEELSKLEYAARLADVPLAGLEGSIKKLSKAMGELAGGGENDAGEAFRALGIQVTAANGQLRPTSAIMADVAEKFAGMQDGAAKTALAMALFGRAGADMIPLLNGGREAIAGAAAELAQFGGVVTPEAAKQAEEFNDNLTRLKAAGEGLAQQVAVQLLPSMVELTNAMVEFAKDGDVAKSVADGIAGTFRFAAEGAIFLSQAVFEVGTLIGILNENFTKADGLAAGLDRWRAGFAAIEAAASKAEQKIYELRGVADPTGSLASIDAMFGTAGGKTDREPVKAKAEAPFMLAKIKTGADEAAQAFDKLKAAGQSVWEQTRTPLEAYQLEIRNLNEMLGAGVIDHETYGRAVTALQDSFAEAQPAAEDFRQTMADLVSSGINQVFEALGGLADGTMKAGDAFASFRDSAVSALKDIAKELLNSTLMNFIGGAGGVAPSQQGGGIMSLFAGFFAGGGRLGAGKWGIAGENGAEPVMGPARIVSNRDMMAGRGGGDVKIRNQIINMNGSQVETQTERGADGGINIKTIVRGEVLETLGGQSGAKMLGGRYGARVKPRRS